jgi:hypothetical protein
MPQNVGAFKLDRADKLVVGTSGLTVVKGKRLGCPCGTQRLPSCLPVYSEVVAKLKGQRL